MHRAALAPILLATLAIVGIAAGATVPAEHAPGCAAVAGNVSRELMERPIGSVAGAGRLQQKVGTKSERAQTYYDQGITLLSSFEWVDAARSFQEALRLDPKLAMAELGLAKAYLGVDAFAEARSHAEKAEALAGNGSVSEKEVLWIGLGRQQLDALQAPDAEQAERLASYRAAIDALIALDPTDPRAWVLRGNAEEPGVWGRGQAGGVASIAYYETALLRAPEDLAAHHFPSHSYENIGRPEQAAEHARRYAALAPKIPHAQHMLGHSCRGWEVAPSPLVSSSRPMPSSAPATVAKSSRPRTTGITGTISTCSASSACASATSARPSAFCVRPTTSKSAARSPATPPDPTCSSCW